MRRQPGEKQRHNLGAGADDCCARKYLQVLLALALIAAGSLALSAQDCAWQWSQQRPRSTDLLRLRHADGRFVAVGRGGNLATSVDTARWLDAETGTDADLYGLAWGNGRWVAVGWDEAGDEGVILSSGDGETWSLELQASGARLHDVAWGGGRFVAVGSGLGDAVLGSTDGQTWNLVACQAGAIEDAVIWADDRFVAATGTQLFASPDGLSWQAIGTVPAPPPTPPPTPPSWDEHLYDSRVDLDWDGSRLLWAGWQYLYRSSDGSSWQLMLDISTTHGWHGFLAVETIPGDPSISYASATYVDPGGYPVGVEHPFARLLVVSGQQPHETYMADGAFWGLAGGEGPGGAPITVAAGVRGSLMTLEGDDLHAWQHLIGTFPRTRNSCESTSLLGCGPLGVLAANDYDPGCIIWNKNGDPQQSNQRVKGAAKQDENYTPAILFSTDGADWSYDALPPFIWVDHRDRHMAAASNSVFVTLASVGVAISQDGHSWNVVPGPVSYTTATHLSWGADRFVAISRNGALFTSDDGSTWSQGTLPGSPTAWFLRRTGSRFFVAAELDDEQILLTSPDGESWTSTPLPLDWPPWAIASDGSRQVLLCGDGPLIGDEQGNWWPAEQQCSGNDIAYGGGRFVTVGGTYSGGLGYGHGDVAVSSDGERWTWFEVPEVEELERVIWTGDRFVAAGYGRNIVRFDCDPSELTLLQLDPVDATMLVGETASFQVTISEAAATTVTISLETGGDEVLSLPSSVLIPPGSTSALFPVRAMSPSTGRVSSVIATLPSSLGGGHASSAVFVSEMTVQQTAIPDLSHPGQAVFLALLLGAGLLALRRCV